MALMLTLALAVAIPGRALSAGAPAQTKPATADAVAPAPRHDRPQIRVHADGAALRARATRAREAAARSLASMGPDARPPAPPNGPTEAVIEEFFRDFDHFPALLRSAKEHGSADEYAELLRHRAWWYLGVKAYFERRARELDEPIRRAESPG
jgi:hypothetical protein